jgi:hypothetical protein
MRDCRDRLANRARLGNAFAHVLAFPLISQILNEMSYFHCRTADHDPKSKVDFPHERRHRAFPFRLFLSGVVESVDGGSDFNGLHSRGHDDEARFYAFDILVSGEVADADHLKVFADEDVADAWFRDNEPEGVAFAYPVIRYARPPAASLRRRGHAP